MGGVNDTSLKLPESKKSVERLKKTSVVLALLVICISGLFYINKLFDLFLSNFFGMTTYAFIAFLLSSFFLLFESKLANRDTKPQNKRLFFVSLSFILSLSVLFIGYIFLSDYSFKNNISYLFLDINFYSRETLLTIGTCFTLISLAFIFARIKIKFHYFIAQLLVLSITLIATLNLVDYLYQLFTPLRLKFIYLPPQIAILFLLLSIATAFRWPTKGFVGIFTTEAVSTIYTLRLLFINIFVVVLFGLISLTGSSNGLYSPYESVAVFSIFVILTATFLAWLNSKLLYKFELERYAMREELKAHNIELKFDNETLTGEMSDLKKENKDYLGKLNTVDQYRKIIEDTE